MSLFGNIFKRFTGLNANQQQLLTSYQSRFDESFDSTGVSINIHSGMRLDTVYTAIKRIADSVASTPVPVYQFDAKNKNKAYTHPIYRLLNVQSNQDMTSYTWKHLSTTHLLGWGNSFSEIERDNAGRIIALNPMHPDDVKLAGRTQDTGEMVYRWNDNQGRTFYFPASDVLHQRGTSFDGVMGISPIMQMRSLVGRAAAREEFQTRFYANGAVLGGVISHPGELTDESLKRFRKSFDELYRGPRNSGKILLLEGAAKFDALGVNPRDAQFVETSKMDAARIAALFGIPMQFLNEVETTTRASAEQLFREFLALGLNTIFSNMEQQYNVSLFTPAEQKTYYTEFLREALIQSDFTALIAGLKDEVLTAILTPNEARGRLNMNPIEGGDVLLAPVNMVPIEQLGKTQAFQAPTKAPESAPEPPKPTEPQAKSLRSESKSNRNASKSSRKHIVKSQQIVLKDAFERCQKREHQDISQLVKKSLRTNKGFDSGIESYYADNSDFTKHFKKTMRSIVDSTSTAVGADVSNQIDSDVGDGGTFADAYLDTMALRYTSSSKRQLQALLTDLPEGDDAGDAIEERLSQWEHGSSDANPTRAEKESNNEATRMVMAMARMFLVAGGVTQLVWSGGECPICQELDGKVVGTEESFASEGDEIGDLKVESNTFAPPLHQGCVCSIDPA